jgi:hypothetical protein
MRLPCVVYDGNVDFRGGTNGISAESIVSNNKYLLLRENISPQRASEIRAKVESLKQVMAYTTSERGTKNSVEIDAQVIAALNYSEDHIFLDNFRQDLLKLMLIKSQLNANLANLSRPGLLDWGSVVSGAIDSASKKKVGLPFLLETLFVGGQEAYAYFKRDELIESLDQIDSEVYGSIKALERIALLYEISSP